MAANTLLHPDVTRFLTTLYAGTSGWLDLRCLAFRPDGTSAVHVTQFAEIRNGVVNAAELSAFLAAADGHDPYVGVGVRTRPERTAYGSLTALFVDADFRHAGEEETLRRLGAFPIKPSIVVLSGAGMHLYWMLDTPIDCSTEAGHAKAKAALSQFARVFDGVIDKQASEPARILRIPASWNHKYAEPRPVQLVTCEPTRRYALADLLAQCPPVTEPVAPVSPIDHAARPVLGDAEVMRLGRGESTGKFSRLYDDEYTGPDHSVADLALCTKLAFYSGDEAQIDRLFRGSKLMRDKWERDDYSTMTIRKALEKTTTVYQPAQPVAIGTAPATAAPAPQNRPLVELVDEHDFLQQTPAPDLVEGLLTVGTVNLLFAPKNRGKTFLAIDLAYAVAAGQPTFLGRRVLQHGPVVGLFAEGGSRLMVRAHACRSARGVHGKVPIGLHARPFDLRSGEHVDALIQTIEQRYPGCKLVVIDTLAQNAAGADENSAKDMGAVLAAAQLLRDRLHTTVLVLHHPSKSDEENDRGSSAFSGGCANTFFVKQKYGIFYLTMKHVRDGAPVDGLPYQLEPVSVPRYQDQDGNPLTSCIVRHLSTPAAVGAAEQAAQTLSDLVLQALTAGGELSAGALADKLGRRKADVLAVLKSLKDRNLVTSQGRSRNTVWRMALDGRDVPFEAAGTVQ